MASLCNNRIHVIMRVCVGIGCEDWAASTEVVIWEIRWAGECGAWAG